MLRNTVETRATLYRNTSRSSAAVSIDLCSMNFHPRERPMTLVPTTRVNFTQEDQPPLTLSTKILHLPCLSPIYTSRNPRPLHEAGRRIVWRIGRIIALGRLDCIIRRSTASPSNTARCCLCSLRLADAAWSAAALRFHWFKSLSVIEQWALRHSDSVNIHHRKRCPVAPASCDSLRIPTRSQSSQ